MAKAKSLAVRKLFAAPEGYDSAVLYNSASIILIPSLTLFVIIGFVTIHDIFWAGFVNPEDTGSEIATTIVHNTPWLLISGAGMFTAARLLRKARKKQ